MWCYEVLGITNSHYITQIEGKLVVDHILKDFLISLPVYYNTKSTNAQGKLKPRSVIMREEGELGFLIIPRV
jgi:hypothetical protein